MRVFVTGGTGCLGSHIVDALRDAGHEVAALVRATSDTRHLQERGAQLLVGDVTDPASLERALRNNPVDAVVHAAAVVNATGDWSHYEEVGVRGTQHVVSAMLAAGVRRLIHISSIAVYDVNAPTDGTEDTRLAPGTPQWNHYAREKVLAEDIVWNAHRSGRLSVTALRPAVIIGPRDRNVAPGILRNLSSPQGRLVGKGDNRVAYVLVQDVASATLLALTTARSEGRAYNLASAQVRTQRELYQAFASASGLQVPVASTPMPVAVFMSRAINWLHKTLRRAGDPPLNPIGAMIWGTDVLVDSQRAREELGWTESGALEVSVHESVRPLLNGGQATVA